MFGDCACNPGQKGEACELGIINTSFVNVSSWDWSYVHEEDGDIACKSIACAECAGVQGLRGTPALYLLQRALVQLRPVWTGMTWNIPSHREASGSSSTLDSCSVE